jgi:hypothetical protein
MYEIKTVKEWWQVLKIFSLCFIKVTGGYYAKKI